MSAPAALVPRRRPLARALGQVGLCAAAFLAVAAGVRRLVPWPEEYGLRAKMEHLAAHKDELDLVFVGSSRVFRAFDPRVFDAALSAAGHPLRSFNLGVGGMRAFEQDYVLGRLLALEPARLRWVLLEGGEWDPAFDYSFNAFSWRSVGWHALPQTLDAVTAALRDARPLRERLRLARTHVELFLTRLSAYGQGREVLAAWLGGGGDERGRSLERHELEQGRGFKAAEEQARASGEAADPWRDPAGYRAQVEAIVAAGRTDAEPATLARVPRAALRRERDETRARGIELLHVLPPGLEAAPVRWALARRGEILVLLDADRPERYPELFAQESRFDPKHLNARGAERFSLLLAEAFLRHLAEGGR